MTEDSIRNKVNQSRQYVQAKIHSCERWAMWLWWAYCGCILVAGLAAMVTGLGGKPIADAVGAKLSKDATAEVTSNSEPIPTVQGMAEAVDSSPKSEAAAITATGWRTICTTIGVLIVIAQFVGYELTKREKALARAQILNASLKNLVSDVDDLARSHEEVTREYQKLNNAFPEFTD